MPPYLPNFTLDRSMQTKIATHLATRFETNVATVRRLINLDEIEQWGKIRRLGEGDTMIASSLASKYDGKRDSTYIRVCLVISAPALHITHKIYQYDLLVDKNAHRRRADPDYEARSFFGQLTNLFVLNIPDAIPELGLTEGRAIILAAVHSCKIEGKNQIRMPFYTGLGRTEVIDAGSIICSVARFQSDSEKQWFIVDRSNNQGGSVYIPEDF